MATVVVTGAAGFLGQFVTAYLASAGQTVIPVSRRPIPGMCQVQDYSRSPSGDVLIHLAEEANRGKVNRLGESYLTGAAVLTKALAAGSYGRIIYASSGSVYGDQSERPCKVGMPVYPTDTYNKSKLTNERIVLECGGVVIRISNLIGIGMASSNVMSEILCQVPGEGPLRVRDDKPVRDFLSVSDAAAAFGLMVESNFRGIANVGSGIGTSVKALAELALALAGQETRDIMATEHSSRRSINMLEISETREILGWSPSMTLKEQLVWMLAGSRGKHHE